MKITQDMVGKIIKSACWHCHRNLANDCGAGCFEFTEDLHTEAQCAGLNCPYTHIPIGSNLSTDKKPSEVILDNYMRNLSPTANPVWDNRDRAYAQWKHILDWIDQHAEECKCGGKK